MNEKESITNDILNLLKRLDPDSSNAQDLVFNQIHPDGSQRRFFRLDHHRLGRLVAILPPKESSKGIAESHSCWEIGCHLQKSGIPVPEMVGFEPSSGLILCEDLGDIRLHDVVTGKESLREKQLESLYQKIIKELLKMQLEGRRGFKSSWCWDSPRYDRSLMLEKESGYFLESFCRDYLRLEVDEVALGKEFSKLATQASSAPADFFLHRDFQSRNIMIKADRVRLIDFQGGRLGPLGYDLASLLIDPYVGLSQQLQESLFSFYVEQLQDRIAYDENDFRLQYGALALQRNLQALGAFGFLAGKRGKSFFRTAIRPGLLSLQSLLAKPEMGEYSGLRRLTEKCISEVGSQKSECGN